MTLKEKIEEIVEEYGFDKEKAGDLMDAASDIIGAIASHIAVEEPYAVKSIAEYRSVSISIFSFMADDENSLDNEYQGDV